MAKQYISMEECWYTYVIELNNLQKFSFIKKKKVPNNDFDINDLKRNAQGLKS